MPMAVCVITYNEQDRKPIAERINPSHVAQGMNAGSEPDRRIILRRYTAVQTHLFPADSSASYHDLVKWFRDIMDGLT